MKQIGERVILKTLLREGEFSGSIVGIEPIFDLCIVKLDSQETPVVGVPYYEKEPEVVEHYWQFCYPETKNES